MSTCPLKRIHPEIPGYDDCAGVECAWYNYEEGACAILDISKCLTAIYKMKAEDN